MAHNTLQWKSNDGIDFVAQQWTPDGVSPRAVIILIHGLGEHAARYDHLARFFNNAGIAVLAYDQRGHGQTGGKRGHTPNLDALWNDADQAVAQARTRFPNIPLVLYGHSMGGNVMLNYFLRRKPAVAAAISTGAWIKLAFEPSPILVAIGKLTRSIIPGFSQKNQLNVNHISHDPAVVAAYSADPLVHDAITSAMGIDLLQAAEWLYLGKHTTPAPLLCMHGADDQITSPEGTRTFVAGCQGDVTLKIWDGLYHEIHNEPQKQQVFEYTLQWLNDRLNKSAK